MKVKGCFPSSFFRAPAVPCRSFFSCRQGVDFTAVRGLGILTQAGRGATRAPEGAGHHAADFRRLRWTGFTKDASDLTSVTGWRVYSRSRFISPSMRSHDPVFAFGIRAAARATRLFLTITVLSACGGAAAASPSMKRSAFLRHRRCPESMQACLRSLSRRER